MMAIRLVNSILLLLVFITTTGCTCCIASDAEDNYTLASALTKLSAAVEATVRYDEPPPGLNDFELLKLATKEDPKLLEPFAGYQIKTLVQNKHAAVLVCDDAGKVALFEDAGCTSQMDRNHWKNDSKTPCTFSIKLDEVCAP
jgi:hypothetical protein